VSIPAAWPGPGAELLGHTPTVLAMARLLPYRGTFGTPRPPGLPVLPPAPMPSHLGLNPLKAWRWVGVFSADLILCAANVRVGPAHQSFYAVYDRPSGTLLERTGGRVKVGLGPGRVRVIDGEVQIDVDLRESAGVETVTARGGGYAWTRKQGAVPAAGMVMLDGAPRELAGLAMIDDSSGYLPRHTRWRWCAGVGADPEGRTLAWNLSEGVHDSPAASERTLWVDGVATELPPIPIAEDLSRAGDLAFAAEVTRVRNENRLVVRSRYRAPFGTFSGALDGVTVLDGLGVMEDHDAHW
jgi:hypothetical protein